MVQNSLLRLLAPDDIAQMVPYLERVRLERQQVLEEPGQTIEFCHFFESGLCSIVVVGEEEQQTEAAHVGWEGASGTSIVFGAPMAASRAIIQIAGESWRLPADVVVDLAAAIPALRKALLLFSQALTIQLAHSLLATSRYRISPRLSRWLLMCHDRTMGDELALTHDMLAMMLAVRRSSITEELHVLEGLRLIRAQRGSVVILDRPGLIEAAGGSYGIPEREYRRLFQDFAEFAET